MGDGNGNGGDWTLRPAKSTEYFQQCNDADQTVGVTHHATGLGKLKVFDAETQAEYSVPVTDVINQPLDAWRITKK